MITRRIGLVSLGIAAALALALGLWAFEGQPASADPGPDLVVAITAAPPESSALATSGIVTYTVTVTNTGDTAATNVPIRDTLGTGLSLTSVTPGAGVTCADTVEPEINCSAASIAAVSGTATVTVVASVSGGAGTVLNGAYVDATATIVEDNEDADDPNLDCAAVGEGSDVDPATEPDNFDCTSHTVAAAGFDLTLTKTANPAESEALPMGTLVYYTLAVSNTGTGTATNVPIRDTLGTGLTFFSVTPGSGVSGCSGTTTINCTAASIAPGETRTVLVAATVTVASGTVLNGASVDPLNVIGETNDDADDPALSCSTVGEGDDLGAGTEQDNFDCTSHAVGEALDLTITKTASPAAGSSVATGSTITYTLTASATQAATNVVIRDRPGTGLTFVSMAPASGSAGTGVTCSDTTEPDYDCTAASIPAGESRSVTVVATVAATSGTVLNGATVDPANTITESNEDADDPTYDCAAVGEGSDVSPATEEDNFECTSHTIGGLDLRLTKTASPADGSSVASGATITYTVTVTAANAAASNVAIRDTVGSGLSVATVTAGSGVTCSDTTGPEINCTAASIASGASVTVTLTATVSATSGTVINGARVDPAGTITESNEDADDPSLDCTAVGEGSDTGDATEPDNFDCTSHTVGGGGAGTRTLSLSPAGWHNFVWTGASGTALETAFACISGKFSIAYEWVDSLQVFERYVPGQASLTNMDPLTQYDHAFVLITAENVTCVMPVVTP